MPPPTEVHHISPDTPLRLDRAVELAFPVGGTIYTIVEVLGRAHRQNGSG
jgi:hypothetical protein